MSILNTIKRFVGLGDDEYFDDDYYADEEFDDDGFEEEPAPKKMSQPFALRKSVSKVVPISSAASSRIRIMKPAEFDDSRNVAKEIQEGRPVIFDVGALETDEARRIVDFVSGAVFGVDGDIKRVSGGTFVAAPKNYDITGENLKEHTKSSFDWNL